MPSCCTHNCRQGRDCHLRRPRPPAAVMREAARNARTWAKRFAVSVLMHTGFLSPSMLLLWLEWLRDDMHPQHPGMPTVLAEIAETEERCRA